MIEVTERDYVTNRIIEVRDERGTHYPIRWYDRLLCHACGKPMPCPTIREAIEQEREARPAIEDRDPGDEG